MTFGYNQMELVLKGLKGPCITLQIEKLEGQSLFDFGWETALYLKFIYLFTNALNLLTQPALPPELFITRTCRMFWEWGTFLGGIFSLTNPFSSLLLIHSPLDPLSVKARESWGTAEITVQHRSIHFLCC